MRIFAIFLCIYYSLINHSIAQIDWVGNIFPNTPTSVQQNTPFNIYIQVWKNGVTNNAGQGAGISCFIHYGQVNTFGGAWSNVTDVEMNYNVDIGNNDEYQESLNLIAGLYEYTCRCTDDNGLNWSWAGSNIQLTVNAPAPVKLISFNISGNKDIKLNWQTSSEINNDYFEVQYSEDGKTFQSIGKVDGSGNSSRTTQYEFMHENPTAGTSYYRLKQVDFDGKFEYSPVKSIYVSEADVRIFPNPVTDMLHFSGLDDQPRDLIIKDMTGKEVYSVKELSASSLDISELKNGMYIIYLISPHRTIREKLLKQ